MPKQISENTIKQIIIDYKDNFLSQQKISKKLNISIDSVIKYLKINKVAIREQSYARREYSIDENFFEKIDTEEKAYWLGFLYADGCAYKRLYLVNITLSSIDIEHLEKFKNSIKTNKLISTKQVSSGYSPKSKASSLRIQNKKMFYDVVKQGCHPAKSLILKFPTEEQVPTCLIRHFIRGYFDGDGYISIANRKNLRKDYEVGFSGNYEFLNKLSDILSQNNINMHLSKDKTIFRLRCGGRKKVLKYLNWIYQDANVYLDRKYIKYLEIPNEQIRSI